MQFFSKLAKRGADPCTIAHEAADGLCAAKHAGWPGRRRAKGSVGVSTVRCPGTWSVSRPGALGSQGNVVVRYLGRVSVAVCNGATTPRN